MLSVSLPATGAVDGLSQGLPYPLWGRMDERTVEARGLGIQGQHKLLFLEQGFGVRLRVGLPLGQWDDTPPAQGVSPGEALRSPMEGEGPSRQPGCPRPPCLPGQHTHSLPSSSMSSTSYLQVNTEQRMRGDLGGGREGERPQEPAQYAVPAPRAWAALTCWWHGCN